MPIFGISPAFVVSLHGPKFTASDFCDALEIAENLGFEAFQPEIYLRQTLMEWVFGGGKTVAARAQRLGLAPTQFIAHFLHECFSTPQALASGRGIEELKRVIEIVKEFDGCRVLTIPVLPFEMDWDITPVEYEDLHSRLVEKIAAWLDLTGAADLLLAFEIVPFSILGSIDRLLAICSELNTDKLGLNLDTGHAWACREILPLLPFKLEGKIFGLHLKDNNSNENLPLAPGKGTIEWQPFLKNLRKAGYTGTFDIEIGCKSEKVRREYADGLKYLKSLKID